MTDSVLAAAVGDLARDTAFSGVVRVDMAGEVVLEAAHGLADRRWDVPVEPGTQFNIASGTKGLTALTVLALVERGVLALDTPARSLLGRDLPLVDDAVTVEHLLAHRSGIGDYLDEDAAGSDDYVLPVPVHRLATTEDYLQVLDGHPQVSAPGERFAYNSGGFVVLALLAERAAGAPFPDLVDELVARPAVADRDRIPALRRAAARRRDRVSARHGTSDERAAPACPWQRGRRRLPDRRRRLPPLGRRRRRAGRRA